MARWFRLGLSVPGPFVCRCLNSLAVPRFHSPLIEPGGRFSRTRLSDKNSRFRPREVASSGHSGGPGPAHRAGTRRDTVSIPGSSTLCLRTQPLAEPVAAVPVDGTVRLAHRAEAEVVRPAHAASGSVEPPAPRLVQPGPTAVGQLADLVARGAATFFADGRVPM